MSSPNGDKPFGQLTLADVDARARELQSATGWGPTARVASVARAWSELGRTMKQHGAATVADLGGEAVKRAPALWVVPPGGSLL